MSIWRGEHMNGKKGVLIETESDSTIYGTFMHPD